MKTRAHSPYTLRSVVLCCAAFLLAHNAAAQPMMTAPQPVADTLEETPAFTGWKQFSTGHFRFIFEDSARERAKSFAAIADDAWNAVSAAYDAPPDMTDVLITDRTGVVNAYAQSLSHYIGFFTTPPASPVFGFREDWHRLFFTHELVHVAHFTLRGQEPLASVFGPVMNMIRTSPMPGWYVEGITTVLETELTAGGRGRSPWFELYFKAPTLENDFLDFEEIGQEQEPPRGQIYIMGYLVMRSIADRFGLAALADIERTCGDGVSFDESVELVTGYTPKELFNDARKALVKKYSQERSIPEGLPLVRVRDRADRYRPALATSKEIITIRTDKEGMKAAVRIDPASGTETVLFEGDFPDEFSLAAAENGLIIAALEKTTYEGSPGKSMTSDLYAWSEAGGLRQLTYHGRLYQPALSRDGSKLVATELAGAGYRLVEIDPASGAATVLAESAKMSFAHPALSADGSLIAFLALDGKRAALATALMPKYDFAYPVPESTFTWQANQSGPIADIAYPHWTTRGTLQYASNARGRLEVWEIENGISRPVLSDPAGAFWAASEGGSIYYASYAASGYALKVKPASEYGKVPDFPGPSSPGEIVALGTLAGDYPELEIKMRNARSAADAEKAEEKAAAVQKRKGEAPRTDPQEIGSESSFYNTPRHQLWLPIADILAAPDDDIYFGAGAFGLASGYPLQNGEQTPLIASSVIVYPQAGQAQATFIADFPVFSLNCVLYGNRIIAFDEDSRFVEYSESLASLSRPIIYETFWRDKLSVTAVSGVHAAAVRYSDTVFAAGSAIPFTTGLSGIFSVSSRYSRTSYDQKQLVSFRLDPTLLVSVFPTISRRTWMSGELAAFFTGGSTDIQGEIGIKARYADLPAGVPIPGSLAAPRGAYLDTRYPGRTLFQTAVVFPKDIATRVYMEKMVSWGKNSTDTYVYAADEDPVMTIDPWWYAGLEAEIDADRMQLSCGIQQRLRSDKPFDLASNFSIFFTLKFDALISRF